MRLRLCFPGRQTIPRAPRPPQQFCLADVTASGGSSVACPWIGIPCKPGQQKAPEEQMFLFKADRNCRDHFPPSVFKCERQLLPGTQTWILMRFVAEPGLRDWRPDQHHDEVISKPREGAGNRPFFHHLEEK